MINIAAAFPPITQIAPKFLAFLRRTEDVGEKLGGGKPRGQMGGCRVRQDGAFQFTLRDEGSRGTKGISLFYRDVMKCEPAGNFSDARRRDFALPLTPLCFFPLLFS